MRRNQTSHRFTMTLTAATAPLLLILATLSLGAIWQQPAAPPEPPAADAAPASAPAAERTAPRQPTAEEVIKALQDVTSPARPVIPPTSPGGVIEKPKDVPLEPGSALVRSGRLLPEGYRLVDRPGRMAESPDGGWMFVFEERGRGELEAPIRLLPNRYLEQMERVSEDGGQPLVFVVSGDVTEYRGANYLLVQKLLIRASMGNLK